MNRTVVLIVAALFASAPVAFAQAPDLTPIGAADTLAPEGTVSCFDYYSFGSVQAQLSTNVSTAVSGTPITFSGTVHNSNPYPVVDGALYVKIFKSRGAGNDGNGPDVVDQFFVKGGMSIPAQSSVPIDFAWTIPSYTVAGEYRLATFFTTSRKFNLLGLSFTDDVVGNTVPFKIAGEQTTSVAFDKAGVTVNDSAYHFAAFPPRLSATEPATVKATVRNTLSSSATANIAWTVYQWDAQLRENAVQEETTSVTVPARGSAPVSITVRDAKYPVYLMVGILTWEDTRSIIGVRFVREGVDRTRINFPGITQFPLRAGEEATLFSCLHNAGAADLVPDSRLLLTLLDENWNVIHEYTYEGSVSGAMMAVADRFTPAESYDHFTLDARLYQGDQFIDQAQVVYDCAEIDPQACRTTTADADGFPFNTRTAALIAVFSIAALVLAFASRRIGGWYNPRH